MRVLAWAATPGEYEIAVTTPALPRPSFFARLFRRRRPAPWAYTIASRIEISSTPLARTAPPAPSPPKQRPTSRTLHARVLEVEGGSDVLIDAGTRQGVRPGDRGTLREAGRVIAQIEIVAVYADGSRARVQGTRSAPITARTGVALQMPIRR